MKMTEAFIRNITLDWNRGMFKSLMRKEFGITPYIDDVEELLENKEALIFYAQIILQTACPLYIVKCYKSFLAKNQGGK